MFQRTVRLGALASSSVLMDELTRTLSDKFTVTPAVAEFLQEFLGHARLVNVKPLAVPVCRDTDDDWVLATAMAAGADVIVTGDHDHLAVGSYEGMPIRNSSGGKPLREQ